MSILLDTNALLRLAQPRHPDHISARETVRLLLEQDESVCVVPQNLYEFWSVATRPVEANGLGMSNTETRRELQSIKHVFKLLRDERGILSGWEDLVFESDSKGKAAHDTRLVAAMHRHGLTELLTFNEADFKRYSRMITIRTPQAVT